MVPMYDLWVVDPPAGLLVFWNFPGDTVATQWKAEAQELPLLPEQFGLSD
jgi:hypothetical protein